MTPPNNRFSPANLTDERGVALIVVGAGLLMVARKK